MRIESGVARDAGTGLRRFGARQNQSAEGRLLSIISSRACVQRCGDGEFCWLEERDF